MNYKDTYDKWLKAEYIDELTKEELKNISSDEKEIEDRFYKNLEFGTGGLRGVLGAGTNRMNIYTVAKATQGLANYILKQKGNLKDRGVAIAYDPRRMSAEFCETAALVLNANGIKTYVFDELKPTPMLSFAVRHFACTAGIVVTASHNPKEYNGYKVYWEDGGQVPFPRDEEIITEVNKVEDFSKIKKITKEESIKLGLYNIADETFDDAYTQNVKKQSVNPETIKKTADSMNIVYTPLNGAGNKPIRKILAEVGFKNVFVVKEQENPDPEFTTIGYPNPEEPKVFELALKLANEVSADVIMASDPDADRLGVVAKNSKGEYSYLTGNMIGSLITEYILSQRKVLNKLPKHPVIISTIVSTKLSKEIAKNYAAEFIEVLTGFKYIGEKIKEFEISAEKEFVFGFEESYGYLAGTYARDKDAVVAALLVSELTAYYKTRNMSLLEGMDEIYKKYGYFKEVTKSVAYKGLEGVKTIKRIMETFRKSPILETIGIKVKEIRDYSTGIGKDLFENKGFQTNLPISDVLYYELEDKTWFCIRPSGTEPKLKVYFGVTGKTEELADNKLAQISKDIMGKVQEAAK